MPVIDPQGLFDGDRLAACSDKAKLYWPFLYCASNGFARLEINLTQIRKRCFSVFEKPPSDQEIMDVVEEYTKNYLVLLYEYEGKQWAQFDTAEKYLPKHKSKKDKESPLPAEGAMRRFAEGYVTWKKNKSLCLQYMRKISEISGSFERLEVSESLEISEISEKIRNPSEISENFRKTSEISEKNEEVVRNFGKNQEFVRGIGIGIGTGVGEGTGVGVGFGKPDNEETIFNNNGQEEEEMKAEKQIPVSCQIILHQKAETYSDVINQIKALAQQTSNGQVLREFEEWAQENQGDDFRGKPLSAWLRSRDSMQTEARTAAADPVVTGLARELAYRSDSLVTFDNRQKLGLRRVLDEGFTVEEIIAVFKVFFQNLDTTRADEVRYASMKFVEKAGDLADVARRKAAEKATETEAVTRKAAELQAEAERERVERLAARERELELVDEELPD